MRMVRVFVCYGQDYMVASVNSNCAWVEDVVVNSVLRDRLDVNV
jgi:hypothetical protein